MRLSRERNLEDVSIIVTGTRSGYISSGNLVGGNKGGTLIGKVSAAAVTIKLDFPVPRSPETTIRTPRTPPELPFAAAPPPPPAIHTARKSKTLTHIHTHIYIHMFYLKTKKPKIE